MVHKFSIYARQFAMIGVMHKQAIKSVPVGIQIIGNNDFKIPFIHWTGINSMNYPHQIYGDRVSVFDLFYVMKWDNYNMYIQMRNRQLQMFTMNRTVVELTNIGNADINICPNDEIGDLYII